MAIFKQRDKNTRRKRAQTHEVAIAVARTSYSFHGDSGLAFSTYQDHMETYKVRPKSYHDFQKELLA